jgi:predicted nucleotidyltransferase component of viral defense system
MVINREMHKKVMMEFLTFLNSETHQYILKGETSLLFCYKLDRFSEDIDLDSKESNTTKIGIIVKKFCSEYNYKFNQKKDTATVQRFMIYYNTEEDPLKVEISYRRKRSEFSSEEISIINGIAVYRINNLCAFKINAYLNRSKIRDLYDICFIIKNYYKDLEVLIRSQLVNAFTYKGLDYVITLIETQKDDFFTGDKLCDDFIEACELIGLNDINNVEEQTHNFY